jgi:hypothetical protein
MLASLGCSAASAGATSDVGSATSEAVSAVLASGDAAWESPVDPQPSKLAPKVRTRIGEEGNPTGTVLG